MLEADDVRATVAFWVDALGFTLGDTLDDQNGQLTWASLNRDGVGVMITARHTHEDGSHDHEHPDHPVLTGSLYFNIDDVDAFAGDLTGKAMLDFGPETMPYQMREIGLTDPNGYFLIFGQPVG